jgi:hypothetical protein
MHEDPFLNAINNAWSAECKSYTAEVTSLSPPDSTSSVPYVRIQFASCSNNKTDSKVIESIGSYEICSLDIPIKVSPGGSVKLVNQIMKNGI